jgi:hypothetical protein
MPTLRRLRGKGPQSENSSSALRSETSWRSAFRLGKSPKRGDGEPKNPSPEVGLTGSSPSLESKPDAAISSEADNIWVRAEQMLSNDKRKREIFQAYLEILESELGSGLKPSGTADRQKQLCQLLDAKTQELEDKKWKVRFGDHNVEVRDLLTGAFKNVLTANQLIKSAASASAPAAIACAGVTVVLTVSWPLSKQRCSKPGEACPLHLTRCALRYAYSTAASRSSRRATCYSLKGIGLYLSIDLPSPYCGGSLPIKGKASVSGLKAFHAL